MMCISVKSYLTNSFADVKWEIMYTFALINDVKASHT